MKTYMTFDNTTLSKAVHSAKTAKSLGISLSLATQYIQWLTGITSDQLKPYNKQMKAAYDNNEDSRITMPDKVKMAIFYYYPGLKRNIVNGDIEMNNKSLTNSELNDVYIKVLEMNIKTTKELVFTILDSGWVPRYNPFKEFFNNCDKKPPRHKSGHIDALIKCIQTDTPNAAVFIKKWLVSIIASIHGEHSPIVLVLCGSQNTGKTHFLRYLLPTEFQKYHCDNRLDSGKDSEILMTNKLIINDDEFGGKSKEESKRFKELTSKQFFNIRPPYAKKSEDLMRLAVLSGTTNDEQILNDATGNRRILPVNVLSINHEEYNAIDKEHLFYELYLEYKTGYDWRLKNADIELLADSSVSFKTTSIEEELVIRFFGLSDGSQHNDVQELTITEIMLFIKDETGESLNIKRLGLTLKALGYIQVIKKVNKTTSRIYQVVKLETNKKHGTNLFDRLNN